jgi:hypothetical protein
VNPRNHLKVLTALCLGSLGLAAFGQTSPATVPSPAKAAPSTQALIHYGQLPLSFEPNRGQTSSNVQWLARGPEYTLFLTGSDAVLEMNKITPAKRDSADPKELRPSISSSVVRMSLLGASASQRATGEDLQSGKANYFTGRDPAKWQHDVPMYGKVHMQGVYPGVDLKYYGHRGELEYDFVVAPGADASAIKLSFDGAKPTLAANGDLVLPVEGGPEVRFNKPVVYQMKDGARQPVEGSFVIADSKAGGQVSFHLGAYDHSRELVIDPTLLFVGVLGNGNNVTEAIGMAVDADGEIILTGETSDVDFPVTSGAYQTTCNQGSTHNYVRCGGSAEGYLGSAFVTKISADGTSLVYSTYLHGFSGSELGRSVATDTAGDAIVLGLTESSDFPITSNAYQSLCMPYYQEKGVVGGDPSDFYPIAQSCDGYFAGGGTEWVVGLGTLFIAKLDPTGANLLYSTFFGGTNSVYPFGLALDSSGNIFFTGFMSGAEETWNGSAPVLNVYPQNGTVPFPVTDSAFQSANLAQQVTTLSELSADGQKLLYSTLFGAMDGPNPAFVQALGLAVGPDGIAYVGGETYSDSVPTTAGAVRPACVDSTFYNGGNELGFCEGYTAWLAAFDTTQSGSASLKYATYIGGPEIPFGNAPQNQVWGLAADSENNVYVTGFTVSPSYPTTPGAYSSTCTNFRVGDGCNNTAFLTKINPTGSAYVWSTYFGGTNQSQSQGWAIAFDAQGRVYLYGSDSNYTYDLPLVNPLEPRPGNGSSYAFVATFSPDATQLLFSTPLGNASPNAANVFPVADNGMAIDADGNIYFAAYGGDGGTFPTSPGTYATTAINTNPRTYFGKISPLLAPTTTSLIITPTTATTGQTVTFTATVAGTTPTPTGTVTLTNTSTNPATTLGTITLASGTGQFTASSLAAGSYSVTASYSGDSIYDVSTSTAKTLAIQALATPTLVVTPSSSSLTTKQALSVQVSVSGGSGNPTPTGSVTLSGGGYTSAATSLSSGSATIVIPASSLGVGADTLTVSYSGDSNYSSATGMASVTVTTPLTPTVKATPAVSTLPTSSSLSVGVAVTGSGTTPTGSVTLSGGGYTSAATSLSSGSATIVIPAGSLSVGADTLTVSYSGDSNYSSATGTASVTVTAVPLTPTVKVTPGENALDSGSALSVTTAVTGAGATPTGTVTLTGGGYTSAAVTLSGGSATIAIPANSLSAGTDTLTVSYSGDSNYVAGTGTASVTVTASVFTLAASTPAAVAPGSPAASTVTVTTATGYAGTVTLTCALTTSPAGATDLPTCSGGSSTVTLSSGATTGTATITVSSTSASSSALVWPKAGGKGRGWAGTGGAVLAFLVLLGIPARRRSWRSILGALVLMVALGTLAGCVGKKTPPNTGNLGTTAGSYTFTVTGAGSPSVTPAPTTTFTVTIN